MKRQHVTVICILILGLVFFTLPSFESAWGAEKNPKPMTNIKIAGGRVGDPWYVFAQAWANFISKESTWLRAEVVATPGVTGSVELMKDKPKEYLCLNSFSNFAHYRKGEFAEARGHYLGMRFIANGNSMSQVLITYDPKIKSPEGLAGKTVHVSRKGAANVPDHTAVLKEWGVLDKVKLVHGGYGGGKGKLMDGLVDATFLIFDHIYPTKYGKGQFVSELETKGDVYYIGLDRDKLLKLRREGFATLPVRIPAKALDPKTQLTDIWGYNDVVFFSADEQMDPEIVYEATRVICKTAGQWTKWHPQGEHMTMEFIPAMFILDPNFVHIGAKKYYDEQGIKLKDLADLLR